MSAHYRLTVTDRRCKSRLRFSFFPPLQASFLPPLVFFPPLDESLNSSSSFTPNRILFPRFPQPSDSRSYFLSLFPRCFPHEQHRALSVRSLLPNKAASRGDSTVTRAPLSLFTLALIARAPDPRGNLLFLPFCRLLEFPHAVSPQPEPPLCAAPPF